LGLLFLLSMLILNRRIGMMMVTGALALLIASIIWWRWRGRTRSEEKGRSRDERQGSKDRKDPGLLTLDPRLYSWFLAPRSFFPLQLLLSLICFLLLMLQFWVILLDFSKVRFEDVVVGLPVILVGSMLPMSVSGLGIREMVASLVLPRFGIDQAQAAIGSFLLFLINSLIPGTVGIAIGGNKIRSLYGSNL